MTTENRNDEIDLIEVFFNIYIFLKRKFWFLFIATFIGAALGYSTKFFGSEHFESTMLIESYTLEDDILIEYFDNLQKIIEDRNYQYLSSKFETEIKYISSLKEISAEKLLDEETIININEDIENPNYIKVIVKSNNNDLYKILNKSLLNYLNKEKYITDEIEIFKEQNNALINRIDNEILLIEELQKQNIKNRDYRSGVNIYNDQNSIHKELLGLLKEKQEIQKKLKFATPYRIIEDFIIYQTPVKKTVTYTLTGGFSLSFIVFISLIIRNINKHIRKKNENEEN